MWLNNQVCKVTKTQREFDLRSAFCKCSYKNAIYKNLSILGDYIKAVLREVL